MKKITFGLLFVTGLVLSACGPKPTQAENVSVAGGAYRRMSARTLHDMLGNKDFLLVNVHIPPAGSIAGTDASIPYDEIQQNLGRLPADKNAKIVLYCRSGRMSTIAAEALVKLGYTNIWELNGGMQAWQSAGYPLLSN